MANSRIFVSNLSTHTTEKDLRQLFQDYGYVERVELKSKQNADDVSGEDAKIIAFVTLQIDENDVQYCVNDLNYYSLHGARIKVSVAKESFLDRLKREREEAEQQKSGQQNKQQFVEQPSELLQQNYQNTKRRFAEDEEFDDEDIAPELLISKKRAASSMLNGKIVIQKNYDVTPLHVIEKKKQPQQTQLDAKSTAADEKRKKSLKNMKNAYDQQKTAIKQALAGLDAPIAKKIKFEDADEEEQQDTKKKSKEQSKKARLFDDDDDDDDIAENTVLPDHKGKKGEKLVELQSKQSLDPRFRISERFVDEDELGDDGDDEKANAQHTDDTHNERDWQLGILEQVVGTKIDTTQNAAARNKKMLHYDPSKEEHTKYLRQSKTDDKQSKQTKKKDKDATAAAAETAGPEVSKEVFYVVTDTLQQSLKARGDGFSLLNLFGTAEVNEREDQLKQLSNEKILVNKANRTGAAAALNPFSYDSAPSEDEDEATEAGNAAAITETAAKNETKNAKSSKTKKLKVFLETFFMPKHDVRLKEGAKFFRYTKTKETEENYEEIRNRLKNLIKTKINKSKKSLLASGVKKRKGKKIR